MPSEPSIPNPPPNPPPTIPPPAANADLLLAFLRSRSIPCPHCGYDLRDLASPLCPECSTPLTLQVGSPRPRFAWLLFAMVPGCFSGIAALLLAIPITATVLQNRSAQHLPWPILAAEAFGLLSAASVPLAYHHRHRVLTLTPRSQARFAGLVWVVHVAAAALVVAGMMRLF